MKKAFLILLFLCGIGQTPAHAQFVGGAISAMQWAQEQAYEAFMKIQVVQQLATLKQTYDASVRYYNEFKQLNSGRGFAYNVGQQISSAEDQTIASMQNRVNQNLFNAYNTKTVPDQFFQAVNQAISSNLKYAGDEMAGTISNRQTGINISQNADGLSPKDAANLTAKSEGLQIQMLAQIHEDNLRVLQLLSMQLSANTRRDESESKIIENIQQGLQSRGFNSGGNQ